MENQRLRNLTTRRLHTKMDDVYEDIEFLIGSVVVTHQIPNVLAAMKPFLQEKLPEPIFWDGNHKPSHTGTTEIKPMNDVEKKAFLKKFGELCLFSEDEDTLRIFGIK